MSQFWKRFAQAAIFFGLGMALWSIVLIVGTATAGWRDGVLFGMLIGVVAGVLFGLAKATVTSLMKRSARSTFDASEKIVRDGPANYYKRLAIVGGWLFLTDQQLIFKVPPFTLPIGELSIPLSDISEAQSVSLLWVIPTGLRVVTREGQTERFVVEEHAEWSRAINSLLSPSTQ